MGSIMWWGISMYLPLEYTMGITLFSVAYALWWCITVPQYYQGLPGVKTHEWAEDTSKGLALAVPSLGIVISLVVSLLGYLVIRLLTSVQYSFWDQWMISLLALPFSTAVVIPYVSYELHKLAD